MKKSLFLILALVMILPLLFSCNGDGQKQTKYGTYETAITVTVIIPNLDYVEPTEELPEGEEPVEDPANPKMFYDGTVEIFVDPETVTVEDALNAAFAVINSKWAGTASIDKSGNSTTDNTITIGTRAFRVSPYCAWEIYVNGLETQSAIADRIKANDRIELKWVDDAASTAQTANEAE